MRYRAHAAMLAALAAAVLVLGGPARCAPARVGAWEPVAREDFRFQETRDLIVVEGEILAAGAFGRGQVVSDGHEVRPVAPGAEAGPGVAAWREGRWVGQAGIPARLGWRLAAEGAAVAAVVGDSLYLRAGSRWQAAAKMPAGKLGDLALWRGQPVIGGCFEIEPGQEEALLLRWDGERWLQFDRGPGGPYWSEVSALLVSGDELWIGGSFTATRGRAPANLAVWDGTSWAAPGGGVEGGVVALETFDGGVAVSGTFRRAGDVPCEGLACWRRGGWTALPPLSGSTADPSRGLQPLARRLAAWQGMLVALGPFEFTDSEGRTACGAARLDGDQWRALPGSETWLVPVDFGRPIGHCRADPLDLEPHLYDPPPPPLARWHPGRAAAGDSGLVLVIGGDGKWSAGQGTIVRLGPDGASVLGHDASLQERSAKADWRGRAPFLRVADSPLGPLVLGPRLMGGVYVGGLARHGPDGWEPVGDWLGPDRTSGGSVRVVVPWGDGMVAAGEFQTAGGHLVRHVAQYRDGSWRPLGQGIGFEEVDARALAAGRDDLLLFCGVNWPHACNDARYASFWRFHAGAWSLLGRPRETAVELDNWQVTAAGDTLWGVSPVWSPTAGQRTLDRATGQALYHLSDTTWTRLGAWDHPEVLSLLSWRGCLYALAEDRTRGVKQLVWWGQGGWRLASDRNLPLLATGLVGTEPGVLVPGSPSSLLWDGSQWHAWPEGGSFRPHRATSWAGGRLYRSRDGGLETWSGPLPPPRDIPLPPDEPERPWYGKWKFDLPDLPLPEGVARSDSTRWVLLRGRSQEPFVLEPEGPHGLRYRDLAQDLEFRVLLCDFPLEPGLAYRFRCRTRDVQGSIDFWAGRTVTPERDDRVWSNQRFSGQTGVDIVLVAPPTATRGGIQIQLAAGQGTFTEMTLTREPDPAAGRDDER